MHRDRTCTVQYLFEQQAMLNAPARRAPRAQSSQIAETALVKELGRPGGPGSLYRRFMWLHRAH